MPPKLPFIFLPLKDYVNTILAQTFPVWAFPTPAFDALSQPPWPCIGLFVHSGCGFTRVRRWKRRLASTSRRCTANFVTLDSSHFPCRTGTTSDGSGIAHCNQ